MPSPAATKKLLRGGARTLTANATLTVAEAHYVYRIDAVDLTVTLPPVSEDMYGTTFSFFVQTISATTGLLIKVGATVDLIRCSGVTPLDGKGIVNTAATDAIGDAVVLRADVDGWLVMAKIGTWAREA